MDCKDTFKHTHFIKEKSVHQTLSNLVGLLHANNFVYSKLVMSMNEWVAISYSFCCKGF